MYDPAAVVQAAAEAVESGHFGYALQVLEQVDARARKYKYWKAYVRAHLGLHVEGYASNGSDYHLVAAKQGAETALEAVKKPGKIAVELGMLYCRTLELSGDYAGASERYSNLLLENPSYKGVLTIRFRASQAFKRCDLVEESLANMQQVLDDPISPYDEVDILLLLGLGYEFSESKGSKRMAKEAYKQAYKKAREANKVKFVDLNDDGPEDSAAFDRGFVAPDGYPMMQNLGGLQQQQRAHVPYGEWRDDVDTWTALATKAAENHDMIYALDALTKSLWTPAGQEDMRLWMSFAEMSFLMQDRDAAVQAAATIYYKEPCNIEVRQVLARWDPETWGAHIAYEERTCTKLQAIYRGNLGRRVAAAHKTRVLAERKRRREAAICIQRTVARGVQGRAKAQRRREQIAAEWAAYQRFLLETKSATSIQHCARGWLARLTVQRMRLERDASCTIQRAVRCYNARETLRALKAEWLFKRQTFGAISMQRLLRGHFGRKVARRRYRRFNGARGFQRVFRGFRARRTFKYDISRFRAAKEIQRMARGLIKRVWYKGLRGNCATRIQTAYRSYVCRSSIGPFARAVAQYRPPRKRFEDHLATFSDLLHQHGETIEDDQEPPQAEVAGETWELALPDEPDSPRVKTSRHAAGGPSASLGPGSKRPQTAPPAAHFAGPQGDQSDMSKRRAKCTAVATPNVLLCASNAPDNRGGAKIVDWLERHPREAQTVWLKHWVLGPEGAKLLAKTMEENESLKELGIGKGSQIGIAGAHAISEAMRCHNFRLTKFFVNDQPELGEQGSLPIMKMVGDFFFGRYARLEEVSLRNIGLEDRACAALAEGLALNAKLRSLQLEENCIGDQGAIALSVAFERNEALLELDLSSNRIGSWGAAAIAKELSKTVATNALEILRMDNNFVGNHGGICLRKYLSKCRKANRPMCITVSVNPMQSDVLRAIRVLATALPAYGHRSGEGAVEIQLALHQKKLALNRKAKEQSSLESEQKEEEPASPLTANQLFGQKKSARGMKPLKSPHSPDLPPLKLHWSRRAASPYRSPPWSPVIASPKSRKHLG